MNSLLRFLNYRINTLTLTLLYLQLFHHKKQ